jgi:ribosome-associated protein
MKARDLVALDVHELTSFADAFLIATGTSDRHVRSVADAILETTEGMGRSPLGVEGYDEGRWVLIDLNEVVIHIFQEEVREYYDLERLWNDAPAIELGQPPERPAGRETAR